MKSLRLSDVEMKVGAKLLEITDDAVIVEAGERKEIIPADTVVLAMGARSSNQLAETAADLGIDLVTIGDAKSPRKISEAIREGFEESLKI